MLYALRSMPNAQRRMPFAQKHIEFIIIACLVLLMGAAAHQRNVVWKDNLSLWSDVVKGSPNKARPHDYMGIACYKRGLIKQAIRHHELAVNIDPEYSYPHINLGICYFDQGNVDGAIAEFRYVLSC